MAKPSVVYRIAVTAVPVSVADRETLTGWLYQLEQELPLHAIADVGAVLSPMTSDIVRTDVPLEDRGASQSSNALKVAGLTEYPPVGSQPSQT